MPEHFAHRIGLRFNDYMLLCRALTHSSFLNEHPDAIEDNERLEFLGDAVLDFMIGAWLYNKFPEMKEGQLSKYRSALVQTTTLAEFARSIDLGQALRLGRGEYLASGKVNRVLGWEQGENAWDRTPAFFDAGNIDELKYDTFCGANVSKYLVAEMPKEGNILAFLKRITYSMKYHWFFRRDRIPLTIDLLLQREILSDSTIDMGNILQINGCYIILITYKGNGKPFSGN